MKNAAHLYEVSFFSALWMVFPESWKRSCPNFYAHDCNSDILKTKILLVETWNLHIQKSKNLPNVAIEWITAPSCGLTSHS